MKITFSGPSFIVKALVLAASLCLILTCNKSKSEPKPHLGNENAWVSQKQDNSNSNSNQSTTVGSAAPATGETEVAAKSSGVSRHARNGQRKTPSYASRYSDSETVAVRKPVASAPVPASSTPTTSADPSTLIARASELIERGNLASGAALSGNLGIAAPLSVPNLRATYYRAAADIAQDAIDLLKQQPTPTEPDAKEKYSATLLAGLSVRAEALGLLAVHGESKQGGEAEAAYREYLAAESDVSKKLSAEHQFAAMLNSLGALDKAKAEYERVLALNSKDLRAMVALADIHRQLAAAQQAAGNKSEAERNYRFASGYMDRLDELIPRNPTASAVEDFNRRTLEQPAKADSARPQPTPPRRARPRP